MTRILPVGDSALVVEFGDEIDPAINMAVAAQDYGPGKSVTSTVNYKPKYFLVNGMPHYAGRVPVALSPSAKRFMWRVRR